MRPSYLRKWSSPDGTPLAMRPIAAHDGPGIAGALRSLSPETRRLRFLGPVNAIPDAFVHALIEADPETQYVVIVVRLDSRDEVTIAGGRIVASDEAGVWEFALLVADASQGHGLGKQLLKALIEEARRRKLKRLVGHVSVDNRPMLRIARKHGFWITRDPQDASTCVATLEIGYERRSKSSWFTEWFGR